MSQTVCIDPGHGGKYPGNYNFGVLEKDVVLDVGMRVGHYVRLMSREQDSNTSRIQTVLPRTVDRTVSIAQRVAIAQAHHCDLLVSIHTNSFPLSSANGSEVWISAGGYYRQMSTRVATNILTRLGALGFRTRGVKRDSKLGRFHNGIPVLRGFNRVGPAVLVELGFASNEHDARLLNDHGSREIIAIQLAAAIIEHYGMDPRWELV